VAVLPVPAAAQSARLQQVAVSGRRIAATGTEQAGTAALPFAAVSGDGGQTWREFTLPLPACRAGSDAVAGAGSPAVSALAAAGGGFVATGTCGSPGRLDVLVWSSRDGLHWHAAAPRQAGLSGPGAQQITALTGSATAVTGAGYTATLSGQHPTLWQPPVG
jgi:hypothetical protein